MVFHQIYQHKAQLSLFIAFVVSLISYQAAALVFDLHLGMKKEKETKIKMISILMLTGQSSSLLTLLNSMLRLDWIAKLYYRGNIPRATGIARDNNRVRKRTVIAVIFLVLITPLIETALVAMTLPMITDISFSKAGFGGIQLGFHNKLQVLETVPFLTVCKQPKFDNRPDDKIDARIVICFCCEILEDVAEENLTGIEVASVSNDIRITVVVRGRKAISTTSSKLQTSKGSFFIKVSLKNSSSKALMEEAVKSFKKECGKITEIGSFHERSSRSNQDFVRADTVFLSVRFECFRDSITSEPEVKIATKFQEMITFVSSNDFVVRRSSRTDYFDAGNLRFLERREQHISTFILICVAAATVIIRAVVNLFVSNDVVGCLEWIVKKRLGFSRCESMFRAGGERIVFLKKYQEGEVVHLGLRQEGIPEVEYFIGGTLQ